MNAAQKMQEDVINRFKNYIDSLDLLTYEELEEIHKRMYYGRRTVDVEYFTPGNSKNPEIRKALFAQFNAYNLPESTNLTISKIKALINEYFKEVPKGYMHFRGLEFFRMKATYTAAQLLNIIKSDLEKNLLLAGTKGNREWFARMFDLNKMMEEVTTKKDK